FRIQVWIPVAAAVVIFDHVFERRQAAIVHVRRRARNLAQGGSFEIALTRAKVGEVAVAPGDAGVVEPLIAEIRADVAGDAVALAAEDLESRLLPGRKRGSVAVDEAVERRIAGENRADEAGQCARDLTRRETDPRGGLRERQVHF